jgi:microcystin-dependent protein
VRLHAAGSNPFLGEIETFLISVPQGGPTQRPTPPYAQNTALFSLLGTTYGGDGRTTFALLTGKPVFTLTPGAPVIQCISLAGISPSRLS